MFVCLLGQGLRPSYRGYQRVRRQPTIDRSAANDRSARLRENQRASEAEVVAQIAALDTAIGTHLPEMEPRVAALGERLDALHNHIEEFIRKAYAMAQERSVLLHAHVYTFQASRSSQSDCH